jgi:hypothetical protein
MWTTQDEETSGREVENQKGGEGRYGIQVNVHPLL